MSEESSGWELSATGDRGKIVMTITRSARTSGGPWSLNEGPGRALDGESRLPPAPAFIRLFPPHGTFSPLQAVPHPLSYAANR